MRRKIMKNRALLFIKPHAVRDKTVKFIEDFLTERGVSLESSGELASEKLKQDGIVDRHYFAIAESAVNTPISSLSPSDEAKSRFREAFGEAWDTALKQERLLNAAEMLKRLEGADAAELNELWVDGKQTKLAPGLYAGRLAGHDLYVINGFYPAMRERFTAPGLTIRWYDASFDPAELSWKDFRGKVIGATDPSKAVEGSLRNVLLNRYSELGLEEEPTVTNNGIHASAGPIEGMRERMVWIGADPYQTKLAKALQEAGFSRDTIDGWLENTHAELQDGKREPVFDLTEDMDADEAVRKLAR
jgi:nucleoside diphosphate kinase